MNRTALGLAIIGTGRIGRLRARLAATHPAVRLVGLADRDRARAAAVAEELDVEVATDDVASLLAHDAVTTVIVSTSEGAHLEPVLGALAAGHDVLVEKPLALTLDDADVILDALSRSEGSLHVAYSRRFRRRYHVAKEQIVQGRMGTLTGGAARVYNSRSQAFAMLRRNPNATPVVDALTYYVDLMHWFFEGSRVVEVQAVAQRGVLADAGFEADDVTWALARFDDGAVVNFGVSYALPENYPALGHAARVEILGTDGVMLLDDDHTDQVMYTDVGVPHVYLDDHAVNAVFLSSGTPGDWALGDFIGPLAAETRAWLDHLSVGSSCHLATPAVARATLAVTLAIEAAVRSGRPVSIPER